VLLLHHRYQLLHHHLLPLRLLLLLLVPHSDRHQQQQLLLPLLQLRLLRLQHRQVARSWVPAAAQRTTWNETFHLGTPRLGTLAESHLTCLGTVETCCVQELPLELPVWPLSLFLQAEAETGSHQCNQQQHKHNRHTVTVA
jgi:hypothetical protein